MSLAGRYDRPYGGGNRRFGGKEFEYQETFRTRAAADREATELREGGYKARVLPGPCDFQFHVYARREN